LEESTVNDQSAEQDSNVAETPVDEWSGRALTDDATSIQPQVSVTALVYAAQRRKRRLGRFFAISAALYAVVLIVVFLNLDRADSKRQEQEMQQRLNNLQEAQEELDDSGLVRQMP
jgi:hypothetical protein